MRADWHGRETVTKGEVRYGEGYEKIGPHCNIFNPLTGMLKLQSNGPLYSNTVIGTLTVDGWAVTFGKCNLAYKYFWFGS